MISERLRIQLDRLDKMFPGQEVLFPEQIGQILSISSKQQENLRARGLFPFNLKRIGRRVCADKLEVAEWLAGRSTPSEKSEKPDGTYREAKPSRKRLGQAGRPGIGAALAYEIEASSLRHEFFAEIEWWWRKNG